MSKILDLKLFGTCEICTADDSRVYVFIDCHERGHLVCKECIEKLIEWGLVEQPKFELQDDD